MDLFKEFLLRIIIPMCIGGVVLLLIYGIETVFNVHIREFWKGYWFGCTAIISGSILGKYNT
jgi:hypothetical protein